MALSYSYAAEGLPHAAFSFLHTALGGTVRLQQMSLVLSNLYACERRRDTGHKPDSTVR